MAKILISGGSGLVGQALTEHLMQRGHSVAWLSRSDKAAKVPVFRIDVKKKYVDEKAFADCDVLINLAGSGIVEKAWTKAYKKELIDSRVETVQLLESVLKKTPHNIKLFIGASATGYYGSDISNKVYDETSSAGDDFMAEICERWESAYQPIERLVPRMLVFRIGVVLSNRGGALVKMMPPFKFGFGAPLAGGEQYFPWIHMQDLCAMFTYGIEQNEMQGIYNAVAPEIITNKMFSRSLAKSLHMPFFFPSVPEWVLKIMLGERHVALSRGLLITSEKIKKAGFEFSFPSIEKALNALMNSEAK